MFIRRYFIPQKVEGMFFVPLTETYGTQKIYIVSNYISYKKWGLVITLVSITNFIYI